MEQIDAYLALPLQVRVEAVRADPDRETARARMMATIARLRQDLLGSAGFGFVFSGEMPKLAVLPEYVLTGYPTTESVAEWADKAAISPDGPEYEALANLAMAAKLHLSGNVYETDAHFPGLYFQTSFIIAPSGDTVLRYRRLQSLFAPTPFDVWDKYLDLYGLDGAFPVARTEIGNLACIASEEILYPEIARALALRGAEIFCHSTSEIASPQLTQKDVAKRARAQENLAYVISANSAGVFGNGVPPQSADGKSQIVNHRGKLLTEAGQGETMAAMGTIDLAALRRDRLKPAMENMLARTRTELFSGIYGDTSIQRPNRLLDQGKLRAPERQEFRGWLAETISEMKQKSILSGS